MKVLLEVECDGVTIKVVQGDITALNVEAIVNPANSWLIMGGGVAAAIKRVGGQVIEDEARRHAPLPIGKAIATTAGKLKAKYIIHAPTMQKPSMKINVNNVRLAMRAALNCAEELGVKSIAFPGLGTGAGGVPLREAAEVMVDELKYHLEMGSSLNEVILIDLKDDLTREFLKAVKRLK